MKSAIVFLYFITRSILTLADPCLEMPWSPSGFPYVIATPSLAAACVSQFPYIESVKQQTIEAVYKFTQNNVLAESDNNPPPPFNQNKVDFLGELRRMNSTTYPNDFAFQKDLTVTARKQKNGGHQRYTMGLCYRFYAYQPFDFTADASGKIYTNGQSIVDYYSANHLIADIQYFGVDPTPFFNAQVEKIDGQDAYAYFVNFAKDDVRSHFSRDTEVRFNQAIKKSDQNPWNWLGFDRYEWPQADAVTYQFKLSNGSRFTVAVPWIAVYYGNDLYLQQDWPYLYDTCLPSYLPDPVEEEENATEGTTGEVAEKRAELRGQKVIPGQTIPFSPRGDSNIPDEEREKFQRELRAQEIKAEFEKRSVKGERQGAVYENAFIGCYYIGDIAIVILNSYTQTSANQLISLNECSAGYNAMEINSLFVFTLQNTGGFTCTNRLVTQWIYPDQSYSFNTVLDARYSRYFYAANDYNDRYAEFTEDLSSPNFRNVTTKQQFSDFGFWNNGSVQTRGGLTAKYSNKFLHVALPCADLAANLVPLNPLQNDAIFIVSDGTCGSSCAQTLLWLQTHGVATVIGLGGWINTTSINSVSYPSARSQTLSTEYYFSTLYDLVSGGQFREEYGDDILLPLPHLGSDLIETYWNSYNWYPNPVSADWTKVHEYTRWPSDYNVKFYNFKDIFGAIDAVLPFNPSTPKPECTNFFAPQKCQGRNLVFPGFTGLYTVSFDQYDTISFGNMTASSVSISGRVAAKGHLVLSNLNIGNGISHANPRNPVVALSGRNFTASSISSNSDQKYYTAGSYSLSNVATSKFLTNVTCPGCLNPYFDLAQKCYTKFSQYYASQPVNVVRSTGPGTTWGSLNCDNKATTAYYYQLTVAQFNSIGYYQVANTCNNKATIVITVTGPGDATMSSGGLSGFQQILYNFVDVGKVTVSNTQVNAHILAPNSNFVTSSTQHKGKIVAKDITASNGQLSSVCQI